MKEAHQEGRSAYILWRNLGKPRQGPSCDMMRRSRLAFKYALRQCQNMEDTARADAMAKSLRTKDIKGFWTSVTKHYNKAIPLASTVGGANDPQSIANIWKNHFENLLNSAKRNDYKEYVTTQIKSNDRCEAIVITPDMVAEAIRRLKTGKSCGNDGISAEHFKYSDVRINVLLSLFYTSVITHGYLPLAFMNTIIVPLVKNKTGDTSDVNNYRPIALVTIASKIFENVLLDILQPFMRTCDNQFGFKKAHSTEHSIFVLKHVIDYYRSLNSPVYSCFLDASKCFDKINHWSLFRKLIARGIPILIVRLLVFWYRQQTLCVKWGLVTSPCFTVTNGVRQGGILSPYLFIMYVDDLSVILNSSNIGLYINNNITNHLFYADDLCLMSSSPSGLQSLLNICSDYAVDNDIMFNQKKSQCVVFKPDKFKLSSPEIVLDGSSLNYVDDIKYLGVVLNNLCRDDSDMKRHLRSFYAKSYTIIRKFHNCSLDVKLTLFRAYCLPSYCCHLWFRYKNSTFNKVRVAFNNAYRQLLGYTRFDSASHMFVSNYIDNFETFIRKNVYGFIQRLRKIDNDIVTNIVSSFTTTPSAMWSKWSSVLYTLH